MIQNIFQSFASLYSLVKMSGIFSATEEILNETLHGFHHLLGVPLGQNGPIDGKGMPYRPQPTWISTKLIFRTFATNPLFCLLYPMSAFIGIYPKRQILTSDGVLVHVDPEVEVPQEHGHLYPSREELLQHSDILLEGLKCVASYGAVLGHLVGDGVDDSLIQVRSKHSPVDKLPPC